MTKEQIKYYIDNLNTILDNVSEIPEGKITEEMVFTDIENVYNVFSKDNANIIKEYNITLESFKIIVAVAKQNKEYREQILGRDEANQLLRNIVDIYGNEAYPILGCDSRFFEMSSIDGILSGENNQKYVEFYTELLNKKCRTVASLEELAEILLTTKPEYINTGLIEKFLENSDKQINGEAVLQFMKTAPQSVIDGVILKKLVDRMEGIFQGQVSILEKIPTELYDEDFAKSILNKSEPYLAFTPVFNAIPIQVKSREVWELAISKSNEFIYSLPEQKIDEKMTQEEYEEWCEEVIIRKLRESQDVRNIFYRLKDFQKTSKICEEATNLLDIEKESFEVSNFLKSIPEEKRSRKIYETLLEKSGRIIKEIPYETFEIGLSQQEYEKWVNNIIIKKILSSDNFQDIVLDVPYQRRNGDIWNALLDKCIEKTGNKSILSLDKIPIHYITKEMCERAIKDIGDYEVLIMPTVDRNIEKIEDKEEKEQYEKWIAKFTEEEKEEYRKWYESKIIEYIEKNTTNNIFTLNGIKISGIITMPDEAITINIINKFLELNGPTGITKIPKPSELTNYNEQYEEIVITAIRMIEDKDYNIFKVDPWETLDILETIPEEYITDKVILEAVKKRPHYLKYADVTKENFEELLGIAYKGKLESLGRTELSRQEIELIKKFAKNNADLFSTLKLELLSPEIVNCIGKNSLEKIVRYKDVQYSVLEIAKNEEALRTFGFVLDNLKEDNIFVEPLIELLSMKIRAEQIVEYDSEKKEYIGKPNEFLKIVSNIIENHREELTEEQKIVISYLALNPSEANKITDYSEIVNYVTNKNAELDGIIANEQATLVATKDAYLRRTVGLDYKSVIELVNKYGNDTEELLVKYQGKELTTYKEKAEKEALEIVLKLKSLISENDIDIIRNAYKNTIANEDITQSFKRYKQAIILDSTLRRAYGRDIVQSLNETDKENNIETIEHTMDGKEYIVRKLNGPFNRMISVMNAYRKSQVDGDMYDRWNTNEMAGNHALCYSFINESNPGTALLGDKKGIIISIKKFSEESLTALAPYDLCSDSRENTTMTLRAQKFYMGKNLPNQTRGRYSEADIEVQDVLDGTEEYKKVQIESIVCFEEVDEESIQAAIELSEKLGHKVPIELIDRRELAKQEKEEIEGLLKAFKEGERLQPDLIRQIITKYNNVRNAHMDSSLSDELLGEKKDKENPEAMFNKSHLNKMLEECIEIANQRIKAGNVEEGVHAIAQIKQFIQEEREKNILMYSMREKQKMAGIDINIDYKIDEILRESQERPNIEDTRSESIEFVQSEETLGTATYSILYGKYQAMPEQLSIKELNGNLDIKEIRDAIADVKEKGYYAENNRYDEEHIARVIMFSNAIANLEGMDNETKQLLTETAKYYCCGRQLDIEEEHQEYSAKIAGKELSEKYLPKDISLIQAAIELQNFRSDKHYINEVEQERKEQMSRLSDKYGLTEGEMQKVNNIATYINDAVDLDKARFVCKANDQFKRVYTLPEEKFPLHGLRTETAKRLIQISYGLQDKLATKKLEKMLKFADVRFEQRQMIEDFFTERSIGGDHVIVDREYTESPVVKVEYLKYKFPEIDFEQLINELENNSELTTELPSESNWSLPEIDFEQLLNELENNREVTTELPIASNWLQSAKNISETRLASKVDGASHEVKRGYHELQEQSQDKEAQKEE